MSLFLAKFNLAACETLSVGMPRLRKGPSNGSIVCETRVDLFVFHFQRKLEQLIALQKHQKFLVARV